VPELPEVETTRRGISAHVLASPITQVIVRTPKLRWPIPVDLAEQCLGHSLSQLKRRGKYLLLQLADKPTALIWHLGMSGSLRILTTAETPRKHDHVDLVFRNGNTLRYHDPRRFGALLSTEGDPEQHPLLASLGPEPLSEAFSGDYLYLSLRRRQQAIKAAIMDSKLVVGVGNIYASEALFAAGIHPLKTASSLSRPACARLTEEIKRVLAHAIERGGTTLRDFVGGDGQPGYFAQELSVYGRGGQPCVRCNKPLTERRIGQRSSVYCIRCQRR